MNPKAVQAVQGLHVHLLLLLLPMALQPGVGLGLLQEFPPSFRFRAPTVQFLHPSFATSIFSIQCPAQLSSFHQSGFSSSNFRNMKFFPRSESQSDAPPPTWRTRVPLLVSPLPFDLSAKGDPTSSYATGNIALRVNGVLELPYHDKVEAPTGEVACTQFQ